MPKTKEKKVIGSFRRIAKKEEKFEIARDLKMLGVELKKISKATGLTIEEIENL